MKTEMTTTSKNPVKLEWYIKSLWTKCNNEEIAYTTLEAIELRAFLIQLNLGK